MILLIIFNMKFIHALSFDLFFIYFKIFIGTIDIPYKFELYKVKKIKFYFCL